jgi:hypothetical protein
LLPDSEMSPPLPSFVPPREARLARSMEAQFKTSTRLGRTLDSQ